MISTRPLRSFNAEEKWVYQPRHEKSPTVEKSYKSYKLQTYLR